MKIFGKILLQFVAVCGVFLPLLLLAQDPPPQGHEGPWNVVEAVEYALKNNPDSRMATTRIEQARAKLQEANSSLHPHIFLRGSYDQTNTPMLSFGNILNQDSFDDTIDFNNPGRTDNFKAQAELRYNLYNGGRDKAAISSSTFNRNSRIAEHTSILNLLAFEVVRSFQKIIQAVELVEARESAIEAINASLQVAKARYQAGDLLRQELLNLEVQEARASENLIQAKHALLLTHHAFNNLLGITNAPVEITTTSATNQKIPDNPTYQERPELKAIEHGIEAAKAQLDMAKGSKLPSLDSFASYQVDHGFINDGSGDSWMAGVSLQYLLYDGQATRAKIAERQAALAELEAMKRKTELTLNLELQQAKQTLQQAEERVAVTKKMVRLAEESARLSRARFQQGVVLTSELIDVETRLTDALVRNAQAKAMYTTAIANLRKSVGLQQF